MTDELTTYFALMNAPPIFEPRAIAPAVVVGFDAATTDAAPFCITGADASTPRTKTVFC